MSKEVNVIDGLQKARWGGGHKENSVLGALSVALQAIGDETPYEYLMGVSGGAFRVQMAQPGWCPSAPHANCGFRLYPTLAAAIPYELVEASPDAVVKSIDRGVPAFYSKEEQALVVGYEKQGRAVLLRPYAARKEGYERREVDELLSDWGGFEVLRQKEEPLDRRASWIRSLEIAIELAHTASIEKYAVGFAAYEFWIASLRDGTPREGEQMVGNGHCFYSLIDARGCAIEYLESISAEFDDGAREHLEQAAQLYKEIVGVLTRRNPTELAPMPWFPQAKDWNQDLRNEQAKALEEALALERRAIHELELGFRLADSP